MSQDKISRLVIVGGGSAGWMTAAYLAKVQPWLRISLVESSDIPAIGVGEATIATLARFLARLGLKDCDWMPHCNAAYKYAIRFDNWHQIGDRYWHPFENIPYYKSRVHLAIYWWYQKARQDRLNDRESLYSDCFFGVDFLKENKIPRPPGAADFQHNFRIGSGADAYLQQVAYAYHFDAGLFGDYLKNHLAKPAGVEHIIDKIAQVHLNEQGFITHLDTRGGRKIEADLFVDCSGSDALLIDKTCKEPFESYSDTLFCDRAIAMQIPYMDKNRELRPYTTATAISSGWVWNTPLTSRIGTGYVYCSSFKDETAAEEEYRNFLGADRVRDLNARHIKIRVGKHRRSWVKNCVAIGLSSGFVEPLESTGIHFIHAAIEKLAVALSGGFYNTADVAAYNWFNTAVMEEVRQFLGIHYGLTAREDTPFWREVKYHTNLDIGDLPELLSRSKFRFPNDRNGRTFLNNSWVAVLTGMNYLPEKDITLVIPPKELEPQLAFMKEMKKQKARISKTAPLHSEYLEIMLAKASG